MCEFDNKKLWCWQAVRKWTFGATVVAVQARGLVAAITKVDADAPIAPGTRSAVIDVFVHIFVQHHPQ